MLTYSTLISVEELRAIQKNESVVILDCTYYLADFDKGRKDYMQAHIPGSFFLDILHDLSGPLVSGITGRHPLPDPDVMAATFNACAIDANSQVIAYDQANGVYASRAWWLLKWLGHDQVAVLDGGFAAWQDAGYETDNQWTAPKKGNFIPHLRNELAVDKEMVASGNLNLVDSREYKRYIGETEPIDPVAGHITGAVCIPYMDNVDEKGFWKSKSFLEEKFESLADVVDPPVFYCGSGVTACHNILAYKIATGKDAQLYGGSWSEWINYYPATVGE